MTNIKYVAYYRVSTKGQGESGLGLESQQQIVKHYFQPNEIEHEFTEVASAKNVIDRPKLKEAIRLCNEHGYTLLVAKTDRLSRKTEDALEIFNLLNRRLHSCDIPQEKGATMDKFTLTLFMAMADRERELISIRTKQALARKKAQGFKLGTPANLTKSVSDKGLATRQANAKNNQANRQASELAKSYRSQGCTLSAVAGKLNDLGLKTRRGKAFKATTVKSLLER
jgi:DNA invertase Pin-like site-specific DNA recombinase